VRREVLRVPADHIQDELDLGVGGKIASQGREHRASVIQPTLAIRLFGSGGAVGQPAGPLGFGTPSRLGLFLSVAGSLGENAGQMWPTDQSRLLRQVFVNRASHVIPLQRRRS
jgi:hypothetical protein